LTVNNQPFVYGDYPIFTAEVASTFNELLVMDHLLKTMGATPIDWSLKALCCGGTLTGTVEEAGQRLSYCLLKEARRRGANLVATACPLCQFNLECYQNKMGKRWENHIEMPVFYFTQLMGLAMGVAPDKLGMQKHFVSTDELLSGV